MARTDEDTWDLAVSVGATATVVAVGRSLANRLPNALIYDPFRRTAGARGGRALLHANHQRRTRPRRCRRRC